MTLESVGLRRARGNRTHEQAASPGREGGGRGGMTAAQALSYLEADVKLPVAAELRPSGDSTRSPVDQEKRAHVIPTESVELQ